MKYVLGIDPGVQCGWAVLDMAGVRRGSGVWQLSNSAGEGAGMRFLRLRRYLDDVAVNCGNNIGAVGYEMVAQHVGTDAAHVYGGITATITAWAEELKIPYQGQPWGTVKKLATGSGAAAKYAMVCAANARWQTRIAIKEKLTAKDGKVTTVYSFPGGGDNEADACWIAETLRRSLGGKA